MLRNQNFLSSTKCRQCNRPLLARLVQILPLNEDSHFTIKLQIVEFACVAGSHKDQLSQAIDRCYRDETCMRLTVFLSCQHSKPACPKCILDILFYWNLFAHC